MESPSLSHPSAPISDGFDFGHRLENFRRSDRERERMLEELVKTVQSQDVKLQETVSDLANEQRSRREWQRQAQHVQESYSRIQKQQTANPFVVVLIDGDGAPFLDSLYTRGEEGGKEAAYRLDQELRKQLAAMHPNESTAHWDVMVNIFVNLDGLTAKLRACGLLPPGADLSRFAQAFGLKLFQFIDVGFGKERADYKLRDWFRLFVNNVQCKQLILGGICHDNGYLPMLDPYLNDPAQHVRISFLATLPPQPAYKSMNFRPIRFNNVFRSEHLPNKPQYPLSALSGGSLPYRGPVVHEKIDSVILHRTDSQTNGLDGVSIKSPSPAPTTDSAGTSWARVSKPADDTKEFVVAGKKPSPIKYILYNKDNQRLDTPLPFVDKASQDKLFRRIKEFGKVCNSYHLAGKCPGKCGFQHGEKLTGAELAALRLRARTKACLDKVECEDFDCVSGHVCPYGDRCYGDGCSFEDTHHMDMNPAYKYYLDGHTEDIGSS
ncbi:hypothetical protein CAC42_5548 [Sphaceloma murrayae]|uniref:C3H1-type domain-containing protein n=1 Tax=Sphaceloma murrayae TaxID=2082308 RepID=A0A2K1QYH2_9PEZI|nr:hypothetical protein CAC42_5548 [Sphaceloma murrayae]